jgi:hypothetical protein
MVRGFTDAEFVDAVGPNIIVTNAIIFNHLLALLVARGIVEPVRGVRLQVDLWTFLFGDNPQPGSDPGALPPNSYLDSLDQDVGEWVQEQFDERGVAPCLLSAFGFATSESRSDDLRGLRPRLRSLWRHVLVSPLLYFDDGALRTAAFTLGEAASKLAGRLDRLGRDMTPGEVVAAVTTALAAPPTSVHACQAAVMRAGRQAAVEVLQIDDPTVAFSVEAVRKVFGVIAGLGMNAGDYLRLQAPGATAVWDRSAHDCWFHVNGSDEVIDLEEPVAVTPPWLAALEDLTAHAVSLDSGVASAA